MQYQEIKKWDSRVDGRRMEGERNQEQNDKEKCALGLSEEDVKNIMALFRNNKFSNNILNEEQLRMN